MRKATAFIIYFFLFWTASVFSADVKKIVIFPLDANSGGEGLDWLGEGIALSLGEQLKGRNITVISRSERIRLVENADLPPGARISRASMIRVAQKAAADLLVMGKYSGVERNLKISLRVLDIKTLKLSGEIAANGPLSAAPQMENELAWLVLSNTGLDRGGTRDNFQQKMRKIPNPAYAFFIQSLAEPNQNARIQLLKKSLSIYRDFPQAQFRLGQLHFEQRDCNSAMQHLTMARIEGEAHIEHEFMKGTCIGLKDEFSQATQSLSYVLSIADSYEALNNIGVVYLRKGETGLAINALKAARNLDRSDPVVSLNLAIAELLQGDIPAARSLLEEAIKLHPKNGMLNFLLSYFWKQQGAEDQAKEASDKARSMSVSVDRLLKGTPSDWTRMIFAWKH
ncbi:MAG: tetratricopeptide repeat protein [Acidobacteria bacterium]|nr:tetratricopeptide repeat protein [Acidobacteriota bacterium]